MIINKYNINLYNQFYSRVIAGMLEWRDFNIWQYSNEIEELYVSGFHYIG
jgi:hypothetical protein